MSGSTLTDRRPMSHMLYTASSASEYACSDCGRTFRRHATYRRHRELSHDDVVHSSNKLGQLSAQPRRLSPCPAASKTVNRADDVIETGIETVENCCVDNEICLGDNSNGAVDNAFTSGGNAISNGFVCASLSSSNVSSVNRQQMTAVDVNASVASDVITIKLEHEESTEDDEGELADFKSLSARSGNLLHDKQLQNPAANDDENTADGTSPRDEQSTSSESNARSLQQSSTATGKQELENSGTTGKPAVKDEKLDGTTVQAVGSAALNVATTSIPPATVIKTSTTPKIFVYVKTEPQVPFGTTSSAVVGNCTSVTMVSDEQLIQPLISSGNSKPTGCQFICPICQRLFNSEKYLSMHMSSIHRAPDVGIQQQQPQQISKQAVAIELMSTSSLTTTSSVVTAAAVASARRTLGNPGSRTAASAVVSMAQAPGSQQQAALSSTVAAPLLSAVSLTQQQPAAINGSAGGPTRSSTQWTCNICNKSFAQNSSYKNHIRTHSDDRPYVCSICSIGFKERYHLKKHALFKHTTELNETCRVCGKRFKDSTAVRAHERIHSDVRPYGCTLCGKTFKTSECLWHHENRSKTCGKMAVAAAAAALSSGTLNGVDGRVPNRRQNTQPQQDNNRTSTSGTRRQRRNPASGTSVIKHKPIAQPTSKIDEVQFAVSTISGAKPLTSATPVEVRSSAAVSSLPLNGSIIVSGAAVFNNADVMLANTSSAKSGNDRGTALLAVNSTSAAVQAVGIYRSTSINGQSVTLEATTPSDSIDCELFDDDGLTSMLDANVVDDVSQSALVDDFWQNFDMDQMTSDCCDIYAAEPDVIDSASSTTETASSSSETAEDSEASSEVIDELTKEISLSAANLVSTSSPDAVSLDGNTMSAATSRGSTSCAGGKHHDCARCDKRFASAATLEKHLLVHAEVRPYRCSVCDIGFKLKVHLKKHNLYRHSDDYPCECSVCGKRFKDSSAVRLHERIHSTDRPFQCLHCGKSFKTKENLWGHRNRGPCDKSSSASTVATSCVVTSETSAKLSSQSPLSTVVDTTTSQMDPVTNVSQHFVANNIRLFHSAEFGPILGVPVNARLVFRDVVDRSDDLIHSDDSNKAIPADVAASATTNIASTSSSTLSSGLPRLSSAVMTPHETICTGSARSVCTSSTMSTAAGVLPSTVPTAVVAPIKRQTISTSSPLTCTPAESTGAPSRPTSLLLPPFIRPDSSVDLSVISVGRKRLVPSAKAVQQQSAATRKRSNSASIAERCPTVQKYLALSTADQGSLVPPANGAIPTSIQKLFRLSVPDPTRTMAKNLDTNDGLACATQTPTPLTEFSGLLDDVADALKEAASNMMLVNDVANSQEGDSLTQNNGNQDSVDWNASETNLPSSIISNPENGELDDNWNKLLPSQNSSSSDVVNRRQSQRPFDGNQLVESADDDDLSEASDYQLVFDSCDDVVRSTGSRRDMTDLMICDDDGNDNGDKLLDPFNDYISMTDGAADMMWCGGESTWTPDNDLGGLLIFGPN